MVRHTPKPFTVEVRNSGRRSKPKAVSSVSSHEMEQSRVAAWPGIDQKPAKTPQAAEAAPAAVVMPTGRVLPVLDVPVRRGPIPGIEAPPMMDAPAPITADAPEEPIAVDLEPPIGVVEADARTIAATLLIR